MRRELPWKRRQMRPMMRILFVGCSLVVGVARAEELDFNRDIRPILSENCFYCHGQDPQKREADLRLDQRAAAIEAGALVPGQASESELVRRVLSEDADLRMPPPDSNRRLTTEDKERLRRWVEQGAKYAVHWAFDTPRRPAEPTVEQAGWVRSPIDKFVLAQLEKSGLAPAPEADRRTLIKRLSIDLTGLPPSLAEVEAFVADQSPDAYEKVVDRLLRSPHYGERMALPWLDAARYADSNGFQQDGDTWQWMWRDGLVQALNDDLPFDQFTLWQLAGDLLPEATQAQKIASAFNRNHLHNGEGGAIAEEQRFVNLFDRMDTTATTWLGLTMACAQCHDHKYDPITMRDYYSLLDAFNRVPETGKPSRISSRIRVAEPYLELDPAEGVRKELDELDKKAKELAAVAKPLVDAAYEGWYVSVIGEGNLPKSRNGLANNVVAILLKPEEQRTAAEKKMVETELKRYFNREIRPKLATKIPAIQESDAATSQRTEFEAEHRPRVMVMSDGQPRQTSILDRGDYLSPRENVSFSTPAFLPALDDDLPKNRLGFARWLVSPEHPLTARVQVNRMWQHFFGTGIVKTAEDLGVQSEYPIHGPLLDWLAVEFQSQGWSVKAMHRLIVTSATYRQSSRMTSELANRDPENRLYGRATRIRMPSMLLRDWALAAAGVLDQRLGGKPVYPYQPEGVWESLAITKERDFSYPQSRGGDLYRRSLYTFWRRTVGPANMFDSSNRQTCRVRSSTTSTPLHALTMLNDATWVEASRLLAQAAIAAAPAWEQRLSWVFERVTLRPPKDSELRTLQTIYESQRELFQQQPENAAKFLAIGEALRDTGLDTVEHASLAATCLAILNLDESMTRE